MWLWAWLENEYLKGLIHEDEDDSVFTNTTAGSTLLPPAQDEKDEQADAFADDDDCCSACSCLTLDSSLTPSSSSITSGDRVTLRRDVYSCSNMDHRMREFHEGHEIRDLATAQGIVSACSVLVGMHPDQAAEHLVDFALQNKKPFALIPCCVYHKQFPHRWFSCFQSVCCVLFVMGEY